MTRYHDYVAAMWAKARIDKAEIDHKARADKAEIDRKVREDLAAFVLTLKPVELDEEGIPLDIDEYADPD